MVAEPGSDDDNWDPHARKPDGTCIGLTQQNEQIQAAFSNLQADSTARINKLEADFAQLANYTRELQHKLTTKTANVRDSEMKRIMGINLFKGQEFAKFNKKDSYELWIDSIKNDLYSQLPDAKKFIEYAENPTVEHSTTEISTGRRYLTVTNIKEAIDDSNLTFDCDPKVAEQIDFEIYSLLNNLTREHLVAHGKIKMNNGEHNTCMAQP